MLGELTYVQIFFLVISIILMQYVFKWTLGSKISSKEDMLNQSRKDYHMIRRFQHMSTGLLMLALWTQIPKDMALIALSIGTIGFFLVNAFRMYNSAFNERYIKHFGFLLRPHELNNMPGALYFLVGVTLAVLFFGRLEAYMAIIVLSFGDPFASLCGIYFKSPKISRDKTVAGTLGCALISTFIGLMFFNFAPDFDAVRGEIKNFEFGLVTFIIAVIAELGPSSRKIHFEDNTSIPVYTGLLFSCYWKFFHPCKNYV